MTFKIFSRAPEIAGDGTIVATIELLELAGERHRRKRNYSPRGAHEPILIAASNSIRRHPKRRSAKRFSCLSSFQRGAISIIVSVLTGR
jgi:hypothetical protein